MKKESSKSIMLLDRGSGKILEESVFGNKILRFFYETLAGRAFWGFLFNMSFLSVLLGRYYDSSFSRKSIKGLLATEGCNASEAEFPVEKYTSFNDFFTRKLRDGARSFDPDENKLSSPGDGRLFVYQNLQKNDPVPVKGAKRSLQDLCCSLLPEEGSFAVAVLRLAPVDYHRYHFPCSCVQNSSPYVFRGKYHSVNPVALTKHPDLYVENTRQITRLFSEKFGSFYFIEVGAFGVGSIVQTSGIGKHAKMEEKGYFKFGGSTVILIFENDKIKWDMDLLKNTAKEMESIVKCGNSIASCKEN